MRRLMMMWAVVSSGCATTPATPPDAVGNEVVVSLSRTGCYGRCPSYRATMRADGSVRFEGERYVKVEGLRELGPDAARVDAVLKRADSTELATWAERYELHRVTDLPTVVLTVRTKTIRHSLGDDTAPPELKALEDDLETLLGIRPFVSEGEAR